jgi:hypothetical protein
MDNKENNMCLIGTFIGLCISIGIIIGIFYSIESKEEIKNNGFNRND